jgi:hypothetical protein
MHFIPLPMPWMAVHAYRPRIVHAARSLDHAMRLQVVFPRDLIALPNSTHYRDLHEKGLVFPRMCATMMWWNPLLAMDVVHYTECNKLLIEDILVEFEKPGHRVMGHEIVEVRKHFEEIV